jgi:hypothetical protein
MYDRRAAFVFSSVEAANATGVCYLDGEVSDQLAPDPFCFGDFRHWGVCLCAE